MRFALGATRAGHEELGSTQNQQVLPEWHALQVDDNAGKQCRHAAAHWQVDEKAKQSSVYSTAPKFVFHAYDTPETTPVPFMQTVQVDEKAKQSSVYSAAPKFVFHACDTPETTRVPFMQTVPVRGSQATQGLYH